MGNNTSVPQRELPSNIIRIPYVLESQPYFATSWSPVNPAYDREAYHFGNMAEFLPPPLVDRFSSSIFIERAKRLNDCATKTLPTHRHAYLYILLGLVTCVLNILRLTHNFDTNMSLVASLFILLAIMPLILFSLKHRRLKRELAQILGEYNNADKMMGVTWYLVVFRDRTNRSDPIRNHGRLTFRIEIDVQLRAQVRNSEYVFSPVQAVPLNSNYILNPVQFTVGVPNQ